MSSDSERVRHGSVGVGRRVTWGLPIALLALVALTVWRLGGRASETDHQFAGVTMGTTFSVTVDADLSAEEHERLRAAIEGRLERIDRMMSTFDSASELSRLNRHRGADPFAVSRDLIEVLALARDISERSAGAFDVTVAPLVDAWGFGPGELRNAPPDSTRLATLREHVGYGRVVLDEENSTVLKTDPEALIDLSGIAKGYAAESVSSGLIGFGYTRFLVEVGGELKAMGSRREGRDWRVGIESPDEAMPSMYGTVELRDEAIATSGDYRNFFESEGVRYAHVIDPRTGAPIPFSGLSVSVVHPNGAVADAWATALTVLGADEGYDLASREGLAALFVMRSNDGFEALATPALGDRVVARAETGGP